MCPASYESSLIKCIIDIMNNASDSNFPTGLHSIKNKIQSLDWVREKRGSSSLEVAGWHKRF